MPLSAGHAAAGRGQPIAALTGLADAEALLLAVPAQRLREVCRGLPACAAPLVICAKGLEQATGLRLSEVVAAERPAAAIAALSGPSFASEVAQGLPTAVTIAAEDQTLAQSLALLLASPAFRPYPSGDLLGVELAGALKNVVAIAAGVTMGKGLGENARASLITRGLAELTRLALALGARRETLMGLAGLGDLLLTATSLTSRNTSFGFALAHGRNAAELMASGEKLSEGRIPPRPHANWASGRGRAADRRGGSRHRRGRDQRRCRDRCPAGAAAAAEGVVH